MNLHWIWSIAALEAEIAEVITWLETDPNYSKQDGADQLRQLLERHVFPMHDKAIHEGGRP